MVKNKKKKFECPKKLFRAAGRVGEFNLTKVSRRDVRANLI